VTVPASIEQLLKKHNVSYSLTTLSAAPTAKNNSDVQSITQQHYAQSANAHLLQNTHGEKLLAITPKQTILDLHAVERVLSESYRPIVGDKLKTFIHSLGLDAMVAMPKLGNLPIIVDSHLLETDTLLLGVGVDNEHIDVDGASFKKLRESTIVRDISIPLDVLNRSTPPTLDEKAIRQSVEQFTERRVKQRLEETL